MRSDRIHRALVNIPNRFMLCRLISVATRKYHAPVGRVQDVINDVIVRFADAEFATQQLRILADLETKLPAVSLYRRK
jgi:hypothetical protein